MALSAGINMNHSKLFKGKSGKAYFGTKRFDQTANTRLHMISAAGLMHDNYRMTALDYGHLLDAVFKLTNSRQFYEVVMRLGIFNVLSNNKDDHSKNFSFLMDKDGLWSFSPAYDITYSTSSHGYQSTSVDGKSKDVNYQNFQNLATLFGVDNLKHIVDDVILSLGSFNDLANKYLLPNKTKELIYNDLQMNIKKIFD